MTTGFETRIDELTLSRGGRAVLHGIDLRLRERRIGVIGRNGSGKSSLLRAIAGLAVPESGRVTVGGVDVAHDRAGALDEVGFLFQNPDHQIIFPTVIEEVGFGLRQQGGRDAEALAHQWLERFGRGDWADRPVTALSQGQRHLVCLIAVLAMQPRVIVLDEPMAGLDLPTIEALEAELAWLDQQVIHATHDMSLIAGYDRVLWLEDGRIAADGPAEEVMARYRAAMTGTTDAFADLAG